MERNAPTAAPPAARRLAGVARGIAVLAAIAVAIWLFAALAKGRAPEIPNVPPLSLLVFLFAAVMVLRAFGVFGDARGRGDGSGGDGPDGTQVWFSGGDGESNSDGGDGGDGGD